MKGLRRTPVQGGDRREKPWTPRRAHSRDTDRLGGHTPPAALPASGPASVWRPLTTILTTQPVPGPNGGRGTVQPAEMMGACPNNAARWLGLQVSALGLTWYQELL